VLVWVFSEDGWFRIVFGAVLWSGLLPLLEARLRGVLPWNR
jgi:hypothetical protein